MYILLDVEYILYSLCLSILLSASLCWFRLKWPLGADEGYLWYGVQRVLLGELPHRHFKSYEPGRYWWCAIFFSFLPQTLYTLRISQHVFYAISLGILLTVLMYAGLGWFTVLACGLSLVFWAFPQHKLFESGIFIICLSSCIMYFICPGKMSIFFLGLTTGLALTFGFNLFIYVSASTCVALLMGILLFSHDNTYILPAFFPGFLIASSFFLWPFITDSAFRRMFTQRRIISIIKRRSTNLPLPIPWPFKPIPSAFGTLNTVRQYFIKLLFLCIAFIPAISLLIFGLLQPGHDLTGSPGSGLEIILGSASAGILAWQHAYSRADFPHLAQSISPLIVCSFCLVSYVIPYDVSTLTIMMIYLYLAWPLMAQFTGRLFLKGGGNLTQLKNGSSILMSAREKSILSTVEQMSMNAARSHGTVLALPNLVWVYPLLDLKTPVYDMFCVFPASSIQQSEMINQAVINNVKCALISNRKIDGRDDLRFSNTHPLVWDWLNTHFEILSTNDFSADFYLFQR